MRNQQAEAESAPLLAMTPARKTRGRTALRVALVATLAGTACSESRPPLYPTSFLSSAATGAAPPAPIPTPTPPPPTVTTIVVGDVVDGKVSLRDPSCTLHNGFPVPCRLFELTARQNGTLIVHLNWDAYYWDSLLLLRIDDLYFSSGPAPFSPIVGRQSVVAGRSYNLAVGMFATGEGTCAFTLTTVIE